MWQWNEDRKVEIEFLGKGPDARTPGARSTSVGGVCVEGLPNVFLPDRQIINDCLPKTQVFVEGDRHMKWLALQFPVILELFELGPEPVLLHKVKRWTGERVGLDSAPCKPLSNRIAAAIEHDQKYPTYKEYQRDYKAYQRYNNSEQPRVIAQDDETTAGEVILAGGA